MAQKSSEATYQKVQVTGIIPNDDVNNN